MDPDRQIIKDGAIAIKDGNIRAIGPDIDISQQVQAEKERDLRGALVHPGFIDAHVHLIYHLSRGMVPDFFPRDRIWDEIEMPLISMLSARDENLSTMLACIEMVSNGTTSFADAGCAFSLNSVFEAARLVGLSGIIGLHIEDKARGVPRFYRSTNQCIKALESQLERYPKDPAKQIWGGVCLSGMGRASDELLVKAHNLAVQHGVQMIMHQSHDEKEVLDSLKMHGKRPIEHLADLGILGPNLTLVRMIQVNEREIELVAESGTCVVHCPAASVKHGVGVSRIGKVPEMLQAGVPVSLGSDSPNWSNSFDVANLAYLAATIHREARGELPTISACTALEMATLNGARALGINQRVGSLEVEKQADLVIHTLDKPEAHPPFDPVSNLVYSMRSKTVDTVYVAGNPVLENGKIAGLDMNDLYKQIDKAAGDLAERIGADRHQHWYSI